MSNPIMNCASCHKEYCFMHSNAHMGMTCKEYERKNKKEFKKNMAVVKDAKICPGCGAVVQKSYGCNHMTCICGKEFCYICGADVTGNVENHFLWGCNQYDAPDPVHRNLWLAITGPDFLPCEVRAFRVFVASYFYIVFGPIVLAMMIAVLPLYIPVMAYIIRQAPMTPCSVHFFRWVRAGEASICVICAFCGGATWASLALGFLIPTALFSWFFPEQDSPYLKSVCTRSAICAVLIVYFIAFCISFTMCFPLMFTICCIGGWSLCMCPEWLDHFDPERDLAQVPVIAFAGPNQV